MNVRNLFTDDDAVSPVIGVILMVAITVILAAVIGAFVLNIGGSQEAAPQATLSWQTASDGIEVTHSSGEELPSDEIEIKVDGVGSDTINNNVGAGDTIYINADGTNSVTAQTSGFANTDVPTNDISIIWDSPSSDKSSVIASHSP